METLSLEIKDPLLKYQMTMLDTLLISLNFKSLKMENFIISGNFCNVLLNIYEKKMFSMYDMEMEEEKKLFLQLTVQEIKESANGSSFAYHKK